MAQHDVLINDEVFADVQRLLHWTPEPAPKRPPPRRRQTFMEPGEIAAALGVSRQAIAQTEKRALAKCRRYCERNGWQLRDLLRGGRPNYSRYIWPTCGRGCHRPRIPGPSPRREGGTGRNPTRGRDANRSGTNRTPPPVVDLSCRCSSASVYPFIEVTFSPSLAAGASSYPPGSKASKTSKGCNVVQPTRFSSIHQIVKAHQSRGSRLPDGSLP